MVCLMFALQSFPINLTPLGIMGPNWGAPLHTPGTNCLQWCARGFEGLFPGTPWCREAQPPNCCRPHRCTTSSNQAGKATAIRRIAVRETSVSRHHGGSIEGPLKPHVHYRTIVLRVIRRGASIGPHYAERKVFFQFGARVCWHLRNTRRHQLIRRGGCFIDPARRLQKPRRSMGMQTRRRNYFLIWKKNFEKKLFCFRKKNYFDLEKNKLWREIIFDLEKKTLRRNYFDF